jgi:hypothetical protein
MAMQRIQLPAWRKRFMGRRGNVWAYRRIGVSGREGGNEPNRIVKCVRSFSEIGLPSGRLDQSF